MEHIALFANDAEHARRIVSPLLPALAGAHVVIVACPPTLTRHLGRWVSRGARHQWRQDWSQELFDAIEPDLRRQGASAVERMVGQRPLVAVTDQLRARHPAIKIVDARRPRPGRDDEPLAAGQPVASGRLASTLAATGGLGAILVLAD